MRNFSRNWGIKAYCGLSILRSLTRYFLLRSHPRVGMISTMPKSGTWYCHYFFRFYSMLLGGRDIPDASGIGIIAGPHYRPEIGLDLLHICHALCPGFNHYQGAQLQDWNRLMFRTRGYNHAGARISRLPVLYDPRSNSAVRIAYIYRNPLDQAVSFFHHILNHKDAGMRQWTDEHGGLREFADVWEFIDHSGLEAYIKHYLSFRYMQERYPKNILMLTYEQLSRDPGAAFTRILGHFGHDLSSPARVAAFTRALQLSSMDSMKRIENGLGRSLGNDQANPDSRHVRDGAIGKWKTYLTDNQLGEIESRLHSFGLSLRDFDTE